VSEHYLTLSEEHRYEPEKVKGSRFIAVVAPAADEQQAQALVEKVRTEFADARHVCWAWRVGEDGGSHR
jgi:putative IMPACT (imprinted ancient) family translation regulator